MVVNLVSKKNKEMFDYLGSHSGRDENKFEAINVKHSDAVKINAPILDECPVNIECSIVDSIMTGSQEMFICKVEHVHSDPKFLKENGDLDFNLSK